MYSPLISVIMSVYNGEEYLSATIQSILKQSYENFEFLIVNDGSIDGTLKLLESYKCMDSRIRLFTQENKGLTKSLNFLLDQARGDYIARMDVGDNSHPDRFEMQVNFLKQRKSIGLVGSWIIYVTDDGRIVSCDFLPNDYRGIEKLLLNSINPFPHSSVMIRRSLLEKSNLRYRFKLGQDLDLWQRLMPFCEFGTVEKPLTYVRLVKGGISIVYAEKQKMFHELIKKLNEQRINYGHELEDWMYLEQKILESPDKKSVLENQLSRKYIEGVNYIYSNDLRIARSIFLSLVKDRSLIKKNCLCY